MQYNQGLTLPSNIFSMLSNLKTLNISQSSIKIQPQQFNGLTSLISLSMNLCGLTTIPSGLFDPLIALEMLQLSGNSFATLIAFPSLTNLQYLHLNVSKITTIDANAFLSLPKLRELDLSGNTAITCTEKMFVGLALLSTLKLSNSGLTKESLRPEILAPLVNLTNIDLSLNNFETFHGAVLGKNENLNVIDLTESKIKRIHSNFTDKLRSAEVHLKLKRNLCVDLEFIVLNRDFDRIQHELVACHSPGLAIPKLIILILTIFKIFRFF